MTESKELTVCSHYVWWCPTHSYNIAEFLLDTIVAGGGTKDGRNDHNKMNENDPMPGLPLSYSSGLDDREEAAATTDRVIKFRRGKLLSCVLLCHMFSVGFKARASVFLLLTFTQCVWIISYRDLAWNFLLKRAVAVCGCG